MTNDHPQHPTTKPSKENPMNTATRITLALVGLIVLVLGMTLLPAR